MAFSSTALFFGLGKRGGGTVAQSMTVSLASDQSAIPTAEAKPTIGTATQVADTNVAGTILAANTSRKGATIWNDSTSILYLLLSATGTVSATVCTVKVAPDGYYEVPFGYTGIITGIWSADSTGSARVTEFT